MAQQNPQITTKKETKNIISDSDGNPILEIGQQQYVVRSSTGELIHRSINESIKLECGTIWSPMMLLQNPPVHIGICEQCRKPTLFKHSKSHGIVAMGRAKICNDCGQLCCPRHRKLQDNQWRCSSCAKKYKLAKMIKSIFFKKQERE